MSKIKAFGEAEWVSEKTKELDKLGGRLHQNLLFLCYAFSLPRCFPSAGKNRPPVKRGDSLKMKLQWLEVYTLPSNLIFFWIFLAPLRIQFSTTACSILP